MDKIRNRLLGYWHFSDGGELHITLDGDTPTAMVLDMIETLVRLKREELAKLDARQKVEDA